MVALTRSTPVTAAEVLWVSPTGSDDNPGTQAAPFATAGHAVREASDGDIVQFASGTYHESIQVYRKQLTLQAAPGASVVIDGATLVSDWTRDGGDYWTPWNPVGDRAEVPWVLPDRPQAGWPEQVFRNNTQLEQVTTRANLETGTFYHDTTARRIYIADDPATATMEISDLEWGVYLNEADGSILRDVTVQRFATPRTRQAAVRAYGDDVLVERVTARENAFAGISAIGDRITLLNVVAERNGQNGLHGHFANDLVIDGARVVDNNRERWDPTWASGGIKVTTSPGLVVRNSYIANNFGPGVWTDLEVRDGAIVSNLIENNTRSAIEIELSAHMVLANNVALNNGEAGAYILESSDIDLWNNAFFGNRREIRVFEGNRDVPADRDPRVEWEVRRVTIANNAIGPTGAGFEFESVQVGVDGSLPIRPTGDILGVTSDHNAYWRAPGGVRLSSWTAGTDDQPRPNADLPSHRTYTRQDANSVEFVSTGNPFSLAPEQNDFRLRPGILAGQPIPARIAAYIDGANSGDTTVGPRSRSTVIGAVAPGAERTIFEPGRDVTGNPDDDAVTRMLMPDLNAQVPTATRPQNGAAPFVTTVPFRLFDSRGNGSTGDGQSQSVGRLAPGQVVEFQVAGRGPVPLDAVGAVLNIASTAADTNGFATLFPCSDTPPNTSSLNFGAGQAVSNAAVVSLSDAGTACAVTSTGTEIIIDTTGYVPNNSYLTTFDSVRLLDTRQQGGRLPAGHIIQLPIGGINNVSNDAVSAVLNLTAIKPNRGGYITAYPCGEPRPVASSLNYGSGGATASLEFAQLGGDGSICLYSSSAVDITVDMAGYMFQNADVSFVTPSRILDTRIDGATADNQYARIGARGPEFVLGLDVAGRVGLPADATTAFLSVTVAKTAGPGFVTLFPCGSARPTTANLVFATDSIVNAYAITAIGDNGQVCVFNSSAAEVIIDVIGAI